MVEIMEKPSRQAEMKEAPEKILAPRMAAPLEMMRRLGQEWDRIWDELSTGYGPHGRWPSLFARSRELLRPELGITPGEWSPRVEVLEREGELLLRAELPGLTKNEVKVEVTDEFLTIEGERKVEKKEEKEGYFYSERSYGHFLRSIPLPEGAEPDKARAEFRDGVLEVSMPVPTQPIRKTRQVEIAEKQ